MSPRFPNESAEYRTQRNALLEAEIALRAQTEAVAALRRALPPGGVVPQDYMFQTPNGPVALSGLFEDGKTTLALYSFMLGAEDTTPCPSCTAVVDSLDGAAPHLTQRINLAIAAAAPIERFMALARQRDWRRIQLLSAKDNDFKRDYHGESESGEQLPMMNIFEKDGDTIRHRWATELFFAQSEAGQHPRHVDPIWPLWNLLDMTPDGRGDFQVRLTYD